MTIRRRSDLVWKKIGLTIQISEGEMPTIVPRDGADISDTLSGSSRRADDWARFSRGETVALSAVVIAAWLVVLGFLIIVT